MTDLIRQKHIEFMIYYLTDCALEKIQTFLCISAGCKNASFKIIPVIAAETRGLHSSPLKTET